MKRFLKIIGIIILTLVLVLLGIYFYLIDFGSKNILSNEPRQPKMEIPITYNIGWWANQSDLTIDSLKVDIIESKLNLFTSKSLISYSIRGQIKCKGHWQPKIEEVHISERANSDTTQHYDRIIEITPIVKVVDNEKINGRTQNFYFSNEHTITSNHWGLNKIKFICGQKEQIIELHQRK